MKDRILNVLNEQDKAYTAFELKDILGLNTTEEIEEMLKILNALESDLTIYHTNKDKYMAFCHSHLKKGKMSVSEKGYGFIIMTDEPDIYVDKKNLNNAIDGDMVIAEIISKTSGAKLEGRVLRIASRSYGPLVGEYVFNDSNPTIISNDKKFKQKVVLTKESTKDAVDGHIVVANIIKELDRNTVLAEITTIIGHKNDVGVDVESIIYKHMFSPKFPDEVLEELKDIPNEVREEDKVGRRNLTDWTIFTIDGDDTKDIDDAISIKKLENGNYELGVHIADVSYYVKPGTKLYDEAYERGTSVYLVDRVVPMLPHKLSNGICSLNPGVERLAQSCVMEIDSKGHVVSHDIFESIIKSRIQMTYKKVNKWLEEGIVEEGYAPYTNNLSLMKELSDVLRANKEARGCIDFDTDEAKILADETGKPIDVVLRERGVGEKMIEDFMIVANETVASHVFYMELPFVYRVHGTPKEEKVNDFLDFISLLGYKVTGKVNIQYSSSIQHILDQLKNKKEYKILSSLMLRAMQKAVYQPENIGHFGLASKIYTHFTSPIRRFPDTTVHRLLRTYLYQNDQSKKTVDYFKEYLPVLTEHASLKERDAIECEREVEDMKMAEYMMDHVGEEFTGMISGVTSFGMFVELPNMIEGLVHISDISDDYYNYDERSLSLIGQKSKKRYRIGDEVTVICKSASKEESFIDFEIKKENSEEDEASKEKRKLKVWVKVVISLIVLVILTNLSYSLYIKYAKTNNAKHGDNKKITTEVPVTITKKPDSNELSLVMVGDCLIHRFVYTDAKNADGTYNFDKMFTEVADLIDGHDLAYYNQESNIGGKALGLSAYPRFNSPEEIGDTMVNLGFNLVSLANNHTMDKGEQGVINSVVFWKTKPGVYYTGEALSNEDRESNIRIEEKNGIKYAFFSYTTVTNGLLPPSGKEYLTNIYSKEKVQKDISTVKGKVDLIIVSMHWGEEYTTNPSSNQKQVAKELSEMGVNLVIGNHAHSIQPVEMVNDTLVFYALGNFISAQDTKDKQTGALITLNIKKDASGKITFNDIKADLIYTYFKGSRDFKVYPYTKLNNSLLNNYETYYNKYKSVLTRYSDIVEVK